MKIIKLNLLVVAVGSALAAIVVKEFLLEALFITTSLLCMKESSKL